LTGLVVTKLDGTAKGGAVLSLQGVVQAPVLFLGVGETIDDLVPFEAEAFVRALFDREEA
jgi:fused signal recognition particle receptor